MKKFIIKGDVEMIRKLSNKNLKFLTFFLSLAVFVCLSFNLIFAKESNIKFDKNAPNATGDMKDQKTDAYGKFTLPNPAFTYGNEFYKYSFSGWQVGDDAQNIKKPNEQITVDKDTTLKAIWKFESGSLELEGYRLSNDAFRTISQYSRGVRGITDHSPGIPRTLQFKAELFKEDGTTLIKTIDAADKDTKRSLFSDLKPGKYKIKVTLEGNHFVLFGPDGLLDASDTITTNKPLHEFEITEQKQKVYLKAFFEPKAYGLITKTDVGTFKAWKI